MSNLINHAKTELDCIGMKENNEDEMNLDMRKCILDVIQVFANQGHSGFSANYAANIISKLMKFEPLSPLTGEDSEWSDVSEIGGANDGSLFQNKRCSHVFKDDVGAWDIDGKIFVRPNGECFTNSDSKVPITFPYGPQTEIVEVDE